MSHDATKICVRCKVTPAKRKYRYCPKCFAIVYRWLVDSGIFSSGACPDRRADAVQPEVANEPKSR